MRKIRNAMKGITSRRSRGEVTFDLCNTVLIILICIVLIYPFVYMVSVSFSDWERVGDVRLLPIGFSTDAYAAVFRLPDVQSGYINSFLYTVVGVSISMFLTVLLAYPLSKNWLPGRTFFSVFVLITMYVSGGLIPSYLLVTSLGMKNTIWAIVLPGAVNTYNMIVMRTYFTSSIPAELEESCEIDGANQFQILSKVFLPLAKPILATITLFYLVVAWNAWFPASIYLDEKEMFPIQLVLRNAMTTNIFLANPSAAIGQLSKVNYKSLNYALTVAVILPVLVIYPFCQKYFVKGVMVGALKG